MKKSFALLICGFMSATILTGCGAVSTISEIEKHITSSEKETEETTREGTGDDEVSEEISAENQEGNEALEGRASEEAETDASEGNHLAETVASAIEEGTSSDYVFNSVTARLGKDRENNDIIIIDYDFTNGSNEEISLGRLTAEPTQGGAEMDHPSQTFINQISKEEDGYYYRHSPIEPGQTVIYRDVYSLNDLTSPILIDEVLNSGFKFYIELADKVQETDGQIITLSTDEIQPNLSVNVEHCLFAKKMLETKASVYVLSTVTNTSDKPISLKNLENLRATAVQGGVDLPRAMLSSASIRDELPAGQSMLILDGFYLDNYDPVTFSWYDESALNTETATVTYSMEEIESDSRGFVNDDYDTAAYKDEFVLLEMEVSDFLNDLDEVMKD